MKKKLSKRGVSLLVFVIVVVIVIFLVAAIILSQKSSGKKEIVHSTKTDVDSDYINKMQTEVVFNKKSEGELAIGSQIVASNGEQFYVIGGDTAGTVISENTQKVLLLAKYNLGLDGKQDVSGGNSKCDFSTTNYWSNEKSYPVNLNDYKIPSTEKSIIEKAKIYGETLGTTGRLMRVEEVEALGGSTSSYSTSTCPRFVNSQNYWLGSAASEEYVWAVWRR